MSAVYALTWSDLNPACIISMVCKQAAVDGQSVDTMTNKKKVAMRASTWAVLIQIANTALWQ